jgi:hypothetical protein
MNLLPDEYWLVTLLVGGGLALLIVSIMDRVDRMK